MGHIFAMRREESELVDVLERLAALEQVRGCSTQNYHRGLGHLRVFDRSDGVCKTRSCGY